MQFEIAAEVFSAKTSEAAWQATILEAATVYGWELALRIEDQAYRSLNERARDAGSRSRRSSIKALGLISSWPDLVLVSERLGRAIFVEVKRQTGKLKPEQHARLMTLHNGGLDVRVWRPSNWIDDVEPTLHGRWFSARYGTDRERRALNGALLEKERPR